MNHVKQLISSTTHNGGSSNSFVEVLEYQPNQFCVTRSTSFTGAKNPEEERKVDQFFLDASQLNSLITVLTNASQGIFDEPISSRP